MVACELAEYVPSKYAGELNKIVAEATQSSKTIIRKTTASSLRFILKEKSPYAGLAQKSLQTLIQDQSDTVKVYAIESLVSQRHNVKFFMNTIFPLLSQSFKEKSWRIRYVLVNNMYNILSSVQKNS